MYYPSHQNIPNGKHDRNYISTRYSAKAELFSCKLKFELTNKIRKKAVFYEISLANQHFLVN